MSGKVLVAILLATMLRCGKVLVAILLATMLREAEGLDNGLALTPPLGWDTWCTQGRCGRDWCSSEEVESASDAYHAIVNSGMKDAGYQYVIISDCWAYSTVDIPVGPLLLTCQGSRMGSNQSVTMFIQMGSSVVSTLT